MSLNEIAPVDFVNLPFPPVDVLAIILLLVVLGVSMSFSLSSLDDLNSFSMHDGLLIVIADTCGTCLASECCKLLMRSLNETFGLVDALAIGPGTDDGIKPAMTPAVVFVVALKELSIVFDATVSHIVVTAGVCGADYIQRVILQKMKK